MFIRGYKKMFTKEDLKKFKLLQKKLQYKFCRFHYLQEALTHTSFVNENPHLKLRSNETLEFLGDSVLGLVITEYLFKNFPDYSEGKLSILKSTLVSEQVLSEISRRLDLGDYLILGKGEDRGMTRLRPSVLSNALESIIGAIFLDRGLKAAGKFVHMIYKDKLKNMPKTEILGSFKNRLQHHTQKEFGCIPIYSVVSEKGPSHNKVYEITVSCNKQIYGRGRGSSKKRAEQEAAKDALVALGLEK